VDSLPSQRLFRHYFPIKWLMLAGWVSLPRPPLTCSYGNWQVRMRRPTASALGNRAQLILTFHRSPAGLFLYFAYENRGQKIGKIGAGNRGQ